MTTKPLVLYTDSGTKNNGRFGNQETRIVVCDCFGKVLYEEFVGDKTVNEGELLAIAAALKKFGRRKLKIFCDSQLATNWVTGRFKVSQIERLVPYILNAKKLYKPYTPPDLFGRGRRGRHDLEWIPREYNLAGHYLEEKYGI